MGFEMRLTLLAVTGLLAFPLAAFADLNVIILDENRLPYDLSKSRYENSASNYENSISNYENSKSNYDNSESNYTNSSSNYENGSNGERRLISNRNEFLGYYVFADTGVMNFFNTAGKRVGYKPNNPDTKSVFSASGEWCGTLGNQDGAIVLGLSENCFYRFLLDN